MSRSHVLGGSCPKAGADVAKATRTDCFEATRILCGALQMCAKVVVYGGVGYLSDGWNALDAFVVVNSALLLALPGNVAFQALRGVRAFPSLVCRPREAKNDDFVPKTAIFPLTTGAPRLSHAVQA